ncbi:MAG TPA: zinc-ribbon domain-containing protein [Terriglobales bacterium]|nr:zinc-ribbon domain-containing protein [Terriglobales bacterium]
MDADLSSAEQGPPNSSENSSENSPEKGLEKSPEISAENSPATPAQATVKCPHCGTVMPANAAFCPGCGWSMTPLPAADRAVAAVAYLTFVAGTVILVLPEFRGSRFVRFHAWQSILLWGTFFALTIAALFLSNVAAAMLFLLFGIMASLAMLFLWIVLTLKAWQGERFELPLFGELAARLP